MAEEIKPAMKRTNTGGMTDLISGFADDDGGAAAISGVIQAEKKAGDWYSEKAILVKHGKNVVPMSASLRESGVVDAPIDKVWSQLSNFDFKWNSRVKEINGPEGARVNGLYELNYEDIKQTVALRGVNEYDYLMRWEMVASEPAVGYASARYSIQLKDITMDNQTLMICTCVFSNDAGPNTLQDQQMKLREYVTEIQKVLASK